MKTMMIALGAATMTLAGLVPATPAAAQRYSDYREYRGDRQQYRDYRGQRQTRYDNRYRGYRNDRCKDGDGGTVIGAIAGGLLGNQVVGRYGDKTLGTLLGGAVGAVAGRSIDRADPPRGCRR